MHACTSFGVGEVSGSRPEGSDTKTGVGRRKGKRHGDSEERKPTNTASVSTNIYLICARLITEPCNHRDHSQTEHTVTITDGSSR